MTLREGLQRILAEYPVAKGGEFAGHKLAEFLRRDFPRMLLDIIGDISGSENSEYIVQGSAGQGQWVRCPWIAIFDPLVTESAERGYYPVYLFREDFAGVYFSLNQGVTDVR